jgi:hypothetical protein
MSSTVDTTLILTIPGDAGHVRGTNNSSASTTSSELMKSTLHTVRRRVAATRYQHARYSQTQEQRDLYHPRGCADYAKELAQDQGMPVPAKRRRGTDGR